MAAPNEAQQPPDITAEVLTAALVVIYVSANAKLVGILGRIVREGIAAMDVDYRRMRRRMLRAANAEVAELEKLTRDALPQLFVQLRIESKAHAEREYTRATSYSVADAPTVTLKSHAERSADAIRDDLNGKLGESRGHIVRSVDDLYRSIVAKAAEAQVRGIRTTQQVIGDAYNEFVQHGITGYETRDGRKLPIDAYAEMAVRTAALRAYNVSYEDRLQTLGIRYFIVPNDGKPCPLCWPWQYKVLSPRGKDDVADASIEEARTGGLFHPQCKHVLMPFLPGVTKRPKASPEWSAAQQAKYDATQKLRALERRVRAQKMLRDNAPTVTDKRAAIRRVRATEALIRTHVNQHGLVRRRHRESPRK